MQVIWNKLLGNDHKRVELRKRISSNVLKMMIHVIKDEFVGVINDSLSSGKCPEGWKIYDNINIKDKDKPNKASEYRLINVTDL